MVDRRSRWSAEQVLALAPDASSVKAGRGLATPGPWSSTGTSAEPAAVWGLCAGSGAAPYQTVVDLSGPAYRCSCPSRKFPCKHALALLLLWAAGQVGESVEPVPFAASWLAGRAAKAAEPRAGGPTATPAPVADPAAAARRAEQRAARITAGVAELTRWLGDQARTGLAGADRAGYSRTDPVAARLVDAQAPALAGAVRRLGGVAVSGPAWPSALLAEHALLHLLTQAHGRLDALPAPLAATVRTRTGYPTSTTDVLAAAAVRDRWTVLSLRDRGEDHLTARRVHLAGERTGRTALVVSFAPPGQPLDASLVPGTSIEADLHHYPGFPLRALVGERVGDPGPPVFPAGVSIREAGRRWASALAGDPWVTELPLVLAGVSLSRATDSPEDPRTGPPWALVDDAGDALGVHGEAGVWMLLAVSGGRPCTVVVEHTPQGLRLCAAVVDDALVAL